MSAADYPQGDGNPECPHCHGRGVVPVPKEQRPPFAIGDLTRPCTCILARDVLANVERGWKGLSKADPLSHGETSPLRGQEDKNLRLTLSNKAFREHLRHVAVRMGPNWNFLVTSEVGLMDSWLSNIATEEIEDPDVERRRRMKDATHYQTLIDLIEPPGLLIILLGVKSTRNSATAEVILEAVQHRNYKDKPTWLVDQPMHRLAPGHLAYSPLLEATVADWPRVEILAAGDTPQISPGGFQQFSMGDDLPSTGGAVPPVLSTPSSPVGVGGGNIPENKTAPTQNLLDSSDAFPSHPKKSKGGRNR